MRKYFFLAIISTLVFMSCGKANDEDDLFIPPPTPPVVVETTPTIEELSIAPTDAIIPIYSNVTVTYKGDINTKKIEINGERMPNTNGTKVFEKVAITTKYIVTATNINKTSTKEVTANVGDWKSSNLGLISNHYWTFISYKVWKDEILYVDWSSNSVELTQKWYFYINNTYSIFNADGTPWGSGVSTWSFGDNNKFIWGGTFDIETLNENKFVVSRNIIVNGEVYKEVHTWEVL